MIPQFRQAAALLLVLFLNLPALAGEREERLQIPFPANRNGETVHLEGLLRMPDGPGPFPLALLNHGTGAQAKKQKPEDLDFLARWFLDRGWAAAMVMRRSFGRSGGLYVEAYSCPNPDYAKAGRNAAEDIRASVAHLRDVPGIDRERIVLVGQSSGGWAVLAAAAEAIPGLRGAVSFAGGRGGNPKGERNCPPEENLIEAGRGFGSKAKVPTLWIYAANDNLTPIDLMRRVQEAYAQGSGDSTLRYYDNPKAGGHFVLRHPDYWGGELEAFLARVAK
ncbi:MAG: dienelactone hydrolase family protein [Rhodospirillales bacterium]|nr:dienelactone hydrolase family protein [Rhodospirillales bacterium]